MDNISLATPVLDLFMVGKTYGQRLKKLDIKTVADLIHHYPSRYNDFSLISKISQVQPGETITIQGKILSSQNIITKRAKKIQKIVVDDATGQIEVIFFNQPFLIRILRPGLFVSLAGKVGFFDFHKAFVSPEYEIIKNQNRNCIHTARLVPVYPETYGVSSKWLRSRIAPILKSLFHQISDWLPEKIKREKGLISLKLALKQIHFPKNKQEAKQAKKRLAFDELFLLQLKALKQKQNWQKKKLTFSFSIDKEKVKKFINQLPFSLTSSQNKTYREILNDLKKNKPMNRLLEGDVGSGKTVVAAIAMYVAFLNGRQTALMAPTEILAQQHYQTIKTLLQPLGVKIGLLTGNKKLKIENCKFDILIGTHALIYNKVKLENLSLIVIDEQQRFGVKQRAKLIKKGKAPHLLTMTATPIPRTIALTLYGDLDLSCLTQMPKGRKKVKTWVVPMEKRLSAYKWIKEQILTNKSQAFIVCPLIELSEKEIMKNIKAAEEEFKKLSQKVFPDFKLGLLHGKIKPKNKEKIIKNFKNKKIDILVSTQVIEVGIDIPNATLMIIEAADRFGLSQLHQLRGRVGRSDKQSYCLLFTSCKDKENLSRLKAMEKFNSGFKLAEIDLKLRGPGQIYGLQQHGFINLKIASFNDQVLVLETRKTAKKIINQLNKFPLLKQKFKSYTINLVEPN